MKKSLFIAFISLMTAPMMLFGQSYKKMWKQLEEYDDKDLPQQVIKQANAIADKAKKEKEYGHLLKAQLIAIDAQANVAPDSLRPCVRRLEQELRQTEDGALKAVYATLLCRIYGQNYRLTRVEDDEEDDDEAQSSMLNAQSSKPFTTEELKAMALADPALLARTKAKTFEPMTVKRDDSRYFGDDLLSLIGRTLEGYKEMHEQYVRMGNRPAACLSALWEMQGNRSYCSNWRESEYIHRLDSLIAEYGDLDVSAELAIERYDYLKRRTGATEGDCIDYIHEAVARWPKWPRMNQLRNDELNYTNPQFDVQLKDELLRSDEGQDAELDDIRNIQQLTLNIYKTDLRGDEDLSPNDEDDFPKIQKRMSLMPELTQVHSYTGHAPYEEFKDTLHLAPLPLGVYVLEFKADPQPSTLNPHPLTIRRLLHVSNLFVINEAQPGEKMRYVVVDSKTGQPVSGAKLRLIGREDHTVKEAVCNEKGEYIHRMDQFGEVRQIYASTADDKAYLSTWQNGRYSYSASGNHESVNLFTDRSIYRPGQTVYVAALVHTTSNFINTQAKADRTLTLRLRNANYKIVEEKQVTTDKYGKASAEFILPTGQLNGRYTIECDQARQQFRVEEYKRPTYEVTFEEVKTLYKAGDTLAVEGQARSYAGVGVQGAKVKYTVKRRIAYWWLSYSYYWDYGYIGHGNNDTEISSGEVETDAQGKFTVDVPLELPYDSKKSTMFYQFVVETDVTDQAGETRTGSTMIPLGTREKVLTCDLPEKMLVEEVKSMTFHLYNAAGKDIEGKTVKYKIDGGEWQQALTAKPLPLTSQLTSGKHTLVATLDPPSGDEDEEPLEREFTVFSLDDTKPCMETKDWFYTSASGFSSDGTPVTVQVGSSDADVHIVYSIYAANEIIESGVIDQSNALWNRKLTYEEKYGNGLLLNFAWVKDGKLYAHQATIKRPMPDKKLNIRWETFRDRLTPGQKEEWKLVVTNTDGTPADAQLMAAMYDKSLDQLYPHQWSFAPYLTTPTPSNSWAGSSWGRIYGSIAKSWDRLDVSEMKFSYFDFKVSPRLFGYYWDDDDEPPVLYESVTVRRAAGNKALIDYAAPMVEEMAEEDYMLERHVAGEEDEESESSKLNDQSSKPDEEPGVQMRENLNETAFFYPTLTTDSKGQIALKFTLPESLTTWRFMGIATTQDMKSGYLEGEAVAQKEVMIQPNMPRFIRMGDKAQIQARIFNTSNHQVSGTAMLRLLDPDNNKAVVKLSQPFSVKAGETAVATFDVSPSTFNAQRSTLYICQVSASGKNFSDGEQHYLAVLPNQERVTVTRPFTQHEPGTTTIDIAKLFPAGTNQQKLTLEYTNNPAWLMVQALPSVGNPYEEDAIDQAAWLYSNLIAKTLIAKSSNIKTVFERWKRESANDGSLVSQLAKNEELKDIVLAETPWVVDADRETEQKLRLADFFDENMMSNRISEATKKLSALQQGDGSWSWWPGMKGSFYMTVSIAEMLTRLNVMAGKQSTTSSMLNKAFNFMGKEIVKDVQEMKKWEKEHGQDYGFPSFKALQYLYICALDGRELPKDVKAANAYLIGKMKKDIKNQTIYEKALSAIILAKNGETTRSQEYAQSLKEYTVFTEEKGRYYDTQRAGYSWYDYKIPTEVMAIEALKVITPEDVQTVEEMQRWLLQEKRTQAWDTPINSVNAVYAFLFDNTKLLDAQEQTVLAIDGKPLDLPQSTAGIGYVKTAIQEPKGREFTARKTSTGTSWGAVYAQFMQPVSDIERSSSGIKVKREVLDANGQPLTTNTLKVGDRIKVRITIDSERDLDFVQVLDRRAACMEPVRQLSGYRYGCYCSPKDYSTNYYFDMMPKGKRVVETEYFIDRAGTYETGTCTVQCAYSPEYRATAPSIVLKVQAP